MNNQQSDAWAMLKSDEKAAITLALGHNKSSWQAGEIMDKAHYKYLEIKTRAEKFFRMFTEFIQAHDSIFPPDLELPLHFKVYLQTLLIQRLSLKDTINTLEDGRYTVTSSRERLLMQVITELRKNKEDVYKDFIDLILEFDRWNNFRILPRELQQPSAFKRRNKSRELKHLKNMMGLPEYSIYKIVENYETKKVKDILYVPLMTKVYGSDYYVMTIDRKPLNVNHLSRLGFFIYETVALAEEFGELVSDYIRRKESLDDSSVMNGQRFWPKFRELNKKAMNFTVLEGIIPNRKYIEDSHIELEIRKMRRPKTT